MELWWILVAVPLWSLWRALAEAWQALLDASAESERKAIIERAVVLAFLNSAVIAGMWIIPWPYKLLCFLPSLAPRAVEIVGEGIALFFSVKTRNH